MKRGKRLFLAGHQSAQRPTVEETLATYPEDPLPTHFARACQHLGIEPDLVPLPDHLAYLLAPAIQDG